jgi:MFS family permease
VTLFGLANATDGFLLLKLSEEGASVAVLPLAWLGLHVVKSAISYPAGRLADRLGTWKVVFAGWLFYALSYLGLALARTLAATLAVMAFYGLYHALAEGAERALLADISPAAARGRSFGAYHAFSGIAAILGGLLFGLLWQHLGRGAAFFVAAAVSALSAMLLYILLPRITLPFSSLPQVEQAPNRRLGG